mmetsp:Transcript_3990/g.17807  ORF Transcript_3990/g.17807 Transcript_3990/m.17807 type:complete len:203 (+) Transcript_3990:240-848(+)
MVGGRARGLGPRLRSHDRRAHRGGVLRPAPPSPARRRRRARGRDADPPRARVVARVVRDARRGCELVLARGGTRGRRARAVGPSGPAGHRARAGRRIARGGRDRGGGRARVVRRETRLDPPRPVGVEVSHPRRCRRGGAGKSRSRRSRRGVAGGPERAAGGREATRAGVRRVGRADAARRLRRYYAAGDAAVLRRDRALRLG